MSDFEMKRGDTKVITVRDAVDLDGNVIDFAGGVLRFTAKKAYKDADEAAVIAKSSLAGGGITILGAGDADVHIVPADTAGLPAVGHVLVWDVQFAFSATDVYTLDDGRLAVEPDVTRSVALA